MSTPYDPDATRPFGDEGETRAYPAAGGPPGPPGASGGGGAGRDEGPDRTWWWLVLGVLLVGVAVGVGIALLVSGGDDGGRTRRSTTSSSSTSTSPPSTTAPTEPSTPTTAAAAPSQVSGLSAGAGGGSGEVSLTWNPTPGAAQYRVYRSSSMGTSGSLVGSSTSTNYTDTPGAVAYYQVSAVSGGGLEGERSVQVCGAPPGDSC